MLMSLRKLGLSGNILITQDGKSALNEALAARVIVVKKAPVIEIDLLGIGTEFFILKHLNEARYENRVDDEDHETVMTSSSGRRRVRINIPSRSFEKSQARLDKLASRVEAIQQELEGNSGKDRKKKSKAAKGADAKRLLTLQAPANVLNL